MPDGVCTIRGCFRRQHATGLCRGHYERQRKNGSPLATIPLGCIPPGPKPRGLFPWVCTCAEPVLGTFNECQVCFRKPAHLLGVMHQV